MVKELWNYAVKAADIENAAAFYVSTMGARVMFRGEVYDCKYILIRLGNTRLIIFDKAPYEKDLETELPNGFLHAVYEVDDLDKVIDSLQHYGTKFIMSPRVLKGEFGARRIVFVEAPDGTRVEVMQILEDSGKAG
jgi:extradiol dioxygenase family protein